MPNIYADDVVRYFRRKGSTGFTEPITYLGAEQRNVTALRNSGVNNLEEQNILGSDSYTEISEDAYGNMIIEKSFHINDPTPGAIATDYYKLVTTVYKNGVANADFYFDGDIFKMPDDINRVIFGDGSLMYPDVNTVYGVDWNTFDFVNDTINVYPANFVTVREEELYFITNNGANVIHVLSKTIQKKYVKDGANSKVIYKEDVVNHIA